MARFWMCPRFWMNRGETGVDDTAAGGFRSASGRAARCAKLAAALTTLTLFAAPAQAERITVYIFDFDFSTNVPGQGPIEDAVINVGDIVRWVALDDFHDTIAAVGQDEFWQSEFMQAGDTFEYVFTIPGIYNYYCSPHGFDNGDGTASGMVGTITVLPTPATASILLTAGVWAGRRRR
jgi:plastocyanin